MGGVEGGEDPGANVHALHKALQGGGLFEEGGEGGVPLQALGGARIIMGVKGNQAVGGAPVVQVGDYQVVLIYHVKHWARREGKSSRLLYPRLCLRLTPHTCWYSSRGGCWHG